MGEREAAAWVIAFGLFCALLFAVNEWLYWRNIARIRKEYINAVDADFEKLRGDWLKEARIVNVKAYGSTP